MTFLLCCHVYFTARRILCQFELIHWSCTYIKGLLGKKSEVNYIFYKPLVELTSASVGLSLMTKTQKKTLETSWEDVQCQYFVPHGQQSCPCQPITLTFLHEKKKKKEKKKDNQHPQGSSEGFDCFSYFIFLVILCLFLRNFNTLRNLFLGNLTHVLSLHSNGGYYSQ